MNIDFSLVLVVLTALTGSVVLLDAVYFAPKRKRSITNYQKEQGHAQAHPDDKVVAGLSRLPLWIEYPKSFFPVLLVVLLLRSFVAEPFKIPSGSMIPTLEIGDYILVNKFTYGLRLPVIGTKIYALGEPQRGDVMVFKYPNDPKINYIKRVVGLPGDKVRYFNKQLTINGESVKRELRAELPPGGLPRIRQYEEWLGEEAHQIQTLTLDHRTSGEWTVPDNSYFVLGDNRDSSRDSRMWGMVPEHLIVGRAFAIWLHIENWLPSFKRNGAIH